MGTPAGAYNKENTSNNIVHVLQNVLLVIPAGPNDPGASDLAHRAFQQSAKRRQKVSSSSGAAAAAGVPDMAGMTEDEQLAMALAMSVEVRGGSGLRCFAVASSCLSLLL
jgi:hypothetical protein